MAIVTPVLVRQRTTAFRTVLNPMAITSTVETLARAALVSKRPPFVANMLHLHDLSVDFAVVQRFYRILRLMLAVELQKGVVALLRNFLDFSKLAKNLCQLLVSYPLRERPNVQTSGWYVTHCGQRMSVYKKNAHQFLARSRDFATTFSCPENFVEMVARFLLRSCPPTRSRHVCLEKKS